MAQIARKDVRVEAVEFDDEAVLRRIEALGNKITAGDIEDAVHNGAEIIREEMADLAPRETGALAKNIVRETVTKSRDVVEVSVAPDRERFYGKFVELGATPGPDANPFMAPAFEKKGPEAHDAISDELWRKIERAVNQFPGNL